MRSALVIGLWMTGAAVELAAKKFENVTIAGTSHEEGEARWTDSLSREAYDICENPGVHDKMAALPKPGEKWRGDRDCVQNAVLVQNNSPRAIQCTANIGMPATDLAEASSHSSVFVIQPGAQSIVVAPIGRARDVPERFDSTCKLLPPLPLQPLPVVPGCDWKIRAPNADFYYPTGEIRRGQEGVVEFEFRTDAASKVLKDVMVVSSSGNSQLDLAALKFSRDVRAETNCPDELYRLRIRFALKH